MSNAVRAIPMGPILRVNKRLKPGTRRHPTRPPDCLASRFPTDPAIIPRPVNSDLPTREV